MALNDPATIHSMARNLILTGKMDPLGNRSGPLRQAVLKERTAILAANGWDETKLAQIQADYKGQQAAVGMLVKKGATAEQSMNNALTAGQNLLAYSEAAGGQNHTRVGNAIIQGYKRFENDPTQQKIDSAYQSFITEYSRVLIQSPTGAGQLTDAARHENMNILSSNASASAKRAALEAMTRDMAAVKASIDSQIAQQNDHISHMLDGPQQSSSVKVPRSAIIQLHQNPQLAAAFDAKYGRGSAQKAMFLQ